MQPSQMLTPARRPMGGRAFFERLRERRRLPPGTILLSDPNAPGELAYITEADRMTGLHLIGPPGSGKSKALEHIACRDIDAGTKCVVLIDTGDLADAVIRHAYATGQVDRVIFLDYSHRDRILGFNPLRERPNADLGVEANRDVQAFLRVWGQDSVLSTPRLLTNLYNSIYAVRTAHAGTTEIPEVLAMQPTNVGKTIVRQVENRLVRQQLDSLYELSETRRQELIESAVSRMKIFLLNRFIRLTVGQTAKALDPGAAIDERRIVIVKLQEGPELTEEDARLLGTLLFSAFCREAMSRKEHERRTLSIICDECHKYVPNEVATILATGRKYLVELTLAHQFPQQLIRTDGGVLDRGVLEAVRACARTKLLFGDIEPDQLQLFAAKIALRRWDPYRVKQELHAWRQLVAGHDRVTLHGSSRTRTASSATSDAIPYLRDLFGRIDPQDLGVISEALAQAEGSSESANEALIPIHRTFQELTSREFMNFEEQQLLILQQLVNQPDRHACLLRKGEAGRFFRVRDVRPVDIDDARVDECDREVLEDPAKPYSSPESIEAEIDGRLSRLEVIHAEWVRLERQKHSIPDPDDPAPPAPPLRPRTKSPKRRR